MLIRLLGCQAGLRLCYWPTTGFLMRRPILERLVGIQVNAYVQSLSKIFELKIVIIFIFISLNLCFGCSKEPSH